MANSRTPNWIGLKLRDCNFEPLTFTCYIKSVCLSNGKIHVTHCHKGFSVSDLLNPQFEIGESHRDTQTRTPTCEHSHVTTHVEVGKTKIHTQGTGN